MPTNDFSCLSSSTTDFASDTSPITLLSLPNETLDYVIRFLAGEPALYQPPRPSNEPVHNIRLVNQRLALLGSCHILFRHRCVSERQLVYETTHLTPEGKLRRRYTQQLDIENVPVMYWLSALQNLYPVVTHMTLTNVRFSGQDQGAHSPCVPITSVRQLSLRVNHVNQRDISKFLLYFPNLDTLLLDSDASRYPGVDTKLLLSFPPLTYLRTLSRPPLKWTHLEFSTDLGYTLTDAHQHADLAFHEYCSECRLWNQNAESSEQITVTQLAWKFPSLREVLIPRLVLEDWRQIPGLSSDNNLPLLDGSEDMDGLDWIECMRRRSDVAVWLVEDDPHLDCKDCKEDCLCTRRRPGASLTMTGMSGVDLHRASTTATPNDTDNANPSRPPFRVMQRWEYNMHTSLKRGQPVFIQDYPKFWWTGREAKSFFGLMSYSSYSDMDRRSDEFAHRWQCETPVQERDSSRAKIFGPGDL